jgi:hypothetical protein
LNPTAIGIRAASLKIIYLPAILHCEQCGSLRVGSTPGVHDPGVLLSEMTDEPAQQLMSETAIPLSLRPFHD